MSGEEDVKSVGSQLELSGNDIDEETNALNENWKFMKQFIQQIKRRGKDTMSNESKKVLSEMKNELKAFVNDEEEEVHDKVKPFLFHDEEVMKEKEVRNRTNRPKKERKGEPKEEECSDSAKEINRKLGKKIAKDEFFSTELSESSSDVKRNKLRSQRTKQSARQSSTSDSDSLSEGNAGIRKLLKHLDSRSLPKLEVYQENSGYSLVKYLNKFEDFCKQNYRGKRYLWVGELERHLVGKTLEAYKTLRHFDDEYDEVKLKLLNWYKDEEQLRKIRAKKKFERAKPMPGESLYIYSTRLENLFRVAFPRHMVGTSNTLLYQFKASVNKAMRSVINGQIMSSKLREKRLTWEKVQKCARLQDLENNLDKHNGEGSSDDGGINEIVVNIGKVKSDWEERNKQNRGNVEKREQVTGFQRTSENWNKNQSRKWENTGARPKIVMPLSKQFNQLCYVCKRFGHLPQECRTRLGTCYACGKNDHILRDCPKRNDRVRSWQRNDFRDRRGQSFSPMARMVKRNPLPRHVSQGRDSQRSLGGFNRQFRQSKNLNY